MLSNCSFKHETANDISYSFKGRSMFNRSKHLLLDGDTLHCKRENLINQITNGLLKIKSDDIFVLHLYNGDGIVARIVDIKLDLFELKVRFLNLDKSMFPDQVLHLDDVKSMFKVAEVHRSLVPEGWCHCAVEGDYCGEGCMNTRTAD